MRLGRLDLMIFLILVVATLAVFWKLPTFEFVGIDDSLYVSQNPYVKEGLTKSGFIWAFRTLRSGNWHPLTWLSHMLDTQLFGLRPGMHHLTNLLFHIANTLLLYIVLRRMTGAQWRSALVAALFALHPLHVESVAWVAERKDVLSTFFWLLTMWAHSFYVERPSSSRYLVTLLLFGLGLLAKPMLVTLPFVLLLMDYWPLGRLDMFQRGEKDDLKSKKSVALRLILEKLPFLSMSVASSIVTFIAQKGGGAVAPLESFPLKMRITNAFVSYVQYMGKMIWPQNLAVFYPHPGSLPIWQIAGAGLLLICLSIAFIREARRRPYLTVGWLWYLGTLVPVIGLIQVGGQSMADRYTYVPLIGLFILVTWGVHDLTGGWHHRRTVLSASAVLMLLGLMVSTWFQTSRWKNSTVLFTQALNVTSGNYLAHDALGLELKKQGKNQEAIRHYLEAIRINPRFVVAHNNLGVALEEEGRMDEAIRHYAEALRIQPNYASAHLNMGVALERQGRLVQAISHYNEALRIEPYDLTAHYNLAGALFREGRPEEAIRHYYAALRIDPDDWQSHFNLGVVLSRQGKRKEAAFHFSQVLRIEPQNEGARRALELLSK